MFDDLSWWSVAGCEAWLGYIGARLVMSRRYPGRILVTPGGMVDSIKGSSSSLSSSGFQPWHASFGGDVKMAPLQGVVRSKWCLIFLAGGICLSSGVGSLPCGPPGSDSSSILASLSLCGRPWPVGGFVTCLPLVGSLALLSVSSCGSCDPTSGSHDLMGGVLICGLVTGTTGSRDDVGPCDLAGGVYDLGGCCCCCWWRQTEQLDTVLAASSPSSSPSMSARWTCTKWVPSALRL